MKRSRRSLARPSRCLPGSIAPRSRAGTLQPATSSASTVGSAKHRERAAGDRRALLRGLRLPQVSGPLSRDSRTAPARRAITLGSLAADNDQAIGCRDEIVRDARVAPEHARGDRCLGNPRGAIETPPQAPGFSRQQRAMSSARQACSQARQESAQTRQCSCIGGMALAFRRTDTASLGTGHQLSLHQHRTRLP